MKKLLPYLFILLTVLIFFRPFILKGFLPIPSDTIVGLYNPFRDMYASQYPRGVPFKNFLITDPVRQLIPWKSLSVSLEKQFELPLWNPYSFGGYPLLGNFQSGAFYPLNIPFFIFPFSFAWSIFIFLQPLLAGIFLYWYLRNLKIHPLAAVIGGISFAFSGFSIVWLEWGNVMHTLLWLPLLLLSIDKLTSFNKKELRRNILWSIVFLFSLTSSFLAGHIQLFFYEFLVIAAYFGLRFLQIKNWKLLLTFALLTFCFFVLTAIQWIPTAQFILHSARSVDQNYLTTAGWFVPYQHLLQFIVPDFFGNPATLNYWGVWNYAEFSGYIGILPLLFALFAIIFRKDKKTWFFAGVTLAALLFALPTPLGKLPFQLNIPFLSTSQPTRLLGIVDMCLAVLAALGVDMFIKNKSYKTLWICEAVIGLFIVMWLVVFKFHAGISMDNLLVVKRNLIFPSIFLFVDTLIIVIGTLFRFKNWIILFSIVSLILVSADLVRFADKFTPFTSSEYLFPQEKTLTFLQKNIGDFRYMTDNSQIMAPDFSVMYHLQSVDGYDPLYLQNYAEIIAASERGKPDIHTPFGFNRIITPHNYNSPLMDVLGVKYVLSLQDLHIQKLTKVYQEGETRVYENKHVLPRAFFVKNVESANSKQDFINKVFATDNFTTTAIVLHIQPKNSLSQGSVRIISYQPNRVLLQTENNGDGFLVLTDIYYPSWSARIDGYSTQIYPTDYALRGIFVPKGKHTIAFSDHLF